MTGATETDADDPARRLRDVLRRDTKLVPRSGWVRASIPVRRTPLGSWARAAEGSDYRVWDSHRIADAAPCVVGLGVAARVSGFSTDRVADLLAECRRVLEAVTPIGLESSTGAPAPRWMGGFAFDPSSASVEPWCGFGVSDFVLPRWQFAWTGDRGTVSLLVRAAELARADEWLNELANVWRRISAVPQQVPPLRTPVDAPVTRRETSVTEWTARVDAALGEIRSRRAQKIVAARCTEVVAGAAIDVGAVIERLRGTAGESVLFAVEQGDGVFLGVSPETLVAKSHRIVVADALAGSARRAGGHDDAECRALLASEKDQREHAVVVNGVCRALAPHCELVETAATTTRSLATLHHLWTPIEARVPQGCHVLELVAALHPTPAVCGEPTDRARAWIGRSEGFSRGWYAAPVGWFDASGDGAFVVAIRSALVRSSRAWVYAGAGIVEGSRADAEFAETGVKQAAMLRALGVAP